MCNSSNEGLFAYLTVETKFPAMQKPQINKNSIILLVAFLLFANFGQGQDDTSDKVKNFEFLVRGKALSMVAIEDNWATAVSVGTEVRLFNTFSFVADLVYYRNRLETEVYENWPDTEQYTEYAQLDTRRYLAFEFRYFIPRKITDPKLRPYVNVFNKFGNRDWRTEDEFPLEDGDLYQMFASITDIGTSFGLTTGASRFGVDFNLGIAYRFETQNTETFQSSGPLLYDYKIDASKFRGNMRFNFYWNFMQ
jgi:hypothetical protein